MLKKWHFDAIIESDRHMHFKPRRVLSKQHRLPGTSIDTDFHKWSQKIRNAYATWTVIHQLNLADLNIQAFPNLYAVYLDQSSKIAQEKIQEKIPEMKKQFVNNSETF